uniref:Uncharacterized protein n=2 Tax=Oryza sativa subsp. japonica TaxID=39947 RepID=Q69J77_ORYSJ|nr:hypothetical protein [Oryza sativa Japonica Group]BAD30306.1 hypothetical protein [Oryza sativa Japonica Group]BAD31985.1 hypothetical protein [Oryza sativa Japonica Group]
MGRRPAAERMAAAGTGGDGNGVPTTPDHGGAAAEGRQDLGKLLERLGREIGDRSGENTTPERNGGAHRRPRDTTFRRSDAAAAKATVAHGWRRRMVVVARDARWKGGCGGGMGKRSGGRGRAWHGVAGGASGEVVAAQRGSDGSGGGGRLEIAGERRRCGSAWRAR